jgi:hypothetical protein
MKNYKILAIVMLSGCSLFSAVAPAVSASVECVINDAANGKPIAQIVTDCGGDVAQVVGILLTSADTKVTGSPAYAEAQRVKSTLAATSK